MIPNFVNSITSAGSAGQMPEFICFGVLVDCDY